MTLHPRRERPRTEQLKEPSENEGQLELANSRNRSSRWRTGTRKSRIRCGPLLRDSKGKSNDIEQTSNNGSINVDCWKKSSQVSDRAEVATVTANLTPQMLCLYPDERVAKLVYTTTKSPYREIIRQILWAVATAPQLPAVNVSRKLSMFLVQAMRYQTSQTLSDHIHHSTQTATNA